VGGGEDKHNFRAGRAMFNYVGGGGGAQPSCFYQILLKRNMRDKGLLLGRVPSSSMGEKRCRRDREGKSDVCSFLQDQIGLEGRVNSSGENASVVPKSNQPRKRPLPDCRGSSTSGGGGSRFLLYALKVKI